MLGRKREERRESDLGIEYNIVDWTSLIDLQMVLGGIAWCLSKCKCSSGEMGET